MSKQQNLSHYKSLFVDFHNPEFLEEAFQKFDAREYTKLIKSVKPDMVMFWGRMSIMDTKSLMLPPARHNISVYKPQVIRIPVWPAVAAGCRISQRIP